MLTKGDLGTAPLYLMRGRKQLDQCILVHLWSYRNMGEKLVLKNLAADCHASPSAVKKHLEDMVSEGVLINEGERAYYPNPHFLPVNRPAPEGKKPRERKKKEFPEWVWAVLKMWKEERGAVIGPNDALRCVGLVIQEYGLEKTMDAFEEYCINPKRDEHFDTLNQFRFQVQDYIDHGTDKVQTFAGEFGNGS